VPFDVVSGVALSRISVYLWVNAVKERLLAVTFSCFWGSSSFLTSFITADEKLDFKAEADAGR
jgi:hypothetical protein